MIFIINNEEDSTKVKELLKAKGIQSEEYLSPLHAYVVAECEATVENILFNAKAENIEAAEVKRIYDLNKKEYVDDILDFSEDLNSYSGAIQEYLRRELLVSGKESETN